MVKYQDREIIETPSVTVTATLDMQDDERIDSLTLTNTDDAYESVIISGDDVMDVLRGIHTFLETYPK